MEDPLEGPMITVDELELLRATLQGRLTALLPSEAADGAAMEHSREWYVGVYRTGQRRLLRDALKELASMEVEACVE